jgi:hypothetical protein
MTVESNGAIKKVASARYYKDVRCLIGDMSYEMEKHLTLNDIRILRSTRKPVVLRNNTVRNNLGLNHNE